MKLLAQQEIGELVGVVCPGCSKAKFSGQLFCTACFGKLSAETKLALSQAAPTYEGAYQLAKKQLIG
jgi:uncharacterized OB-fold protein